MTGAEIKELPEDCPTLHHMVERGSRPCIRRHGRLNTAALLDRYGVAGADRASIEARRGAIRFHARTPP
ncbi:DUF7002 family protein [Rhodopila sp.]|uniref:DUF7002 family protein n=1 Tax=Rhodopila sp. TaxID=2480087 RepID=UPI002C13A482|nr:hypothetical protein [Rhodopila sp.]HVZ08341.1 hypothetical protein [Rhodopila sp.]